MALVMLVTMVIWPRALDTKPKQNEYGWFVLLLHIPGERASIRFGISGRLLTPSRAQAWLSCMSEAMDEVGITGPEREEMWGRLVIIHHMINTPEETPNQE